MRHCIVTGYSGGGLALLHQYMQGQSDAVLLGELNTPAQDVMGRSACSVSFCQDDLFKLVDLASIAAAQSIDLTLIVLLRDPRDLLLGLTGDAQALDADDLDLISQFLGELTRANLIPGMQVIKAEDLIVAPGKVQATVAELLGHDMAEPFANRAPAKGGKTLLSDVPLALDPQGQFRAPWSYPQHYARLGHLALNDRRVVALPQAMGYEPGPSWVGPVVAQARSEGGTQSQEDAAARETFDVLHDDPLLRVTYLPGEGDVAVITFIGVGLGTGGIDHQGEEFRRLGKGLGPQVFVFDKTRSWGNSVDMDLLIRLTAPMREGRKVVTLGLSMGGFLAIHGSQALGARVCIAFAPQYSMHPDIAPFERRWARYTDMIVEWTVPSLEMAFGTGCQYTCVFPDDPTDQQHAALFPVADNVTRIMIGDGHHNVARALRDAGKLYPLIGACIDESRDLPLPAGARIIA